MMEHYTTRSLAISSGPRDSLTSLTCALSRAALSERQFLAPGFGRAEIGFLDDPPVPLLLIYRQLHEFRIVAGSDVRWRMNAQYSGFGALKVPGGPVPFRGHHLLYRGERACQERLGNYSVG
jgi:hypothetical protein